MTRAFMFNGHLIDPEDPETWLTRGWGSIAASDIVLTDEACAGIASIRDRAMMLRSCRESAGTGSREG